MSANDTEPKEPKKLIVKRYIKQQDSIQFCVDTICREVKQDTRLVKQVLLTILSAYTNNPINLAINAPTGEGKSYVVGKVAELFPQSDIIFLTAMTDKALFHRRGVLVIKNNETGEYESIDDKIAEIDLQIQEKESEIETTKDRNLKQALCSTIKELEKQKDQLKKDAIKLIDLNHKVLIFEDTPRHTLLEAIMSLLSHDRYEVEYEYVDTFNGIKTKNNVLRGFPTVVFTAAIDYSKNSRWAETQRRFIITNPKMTPTKYKESIQLLGARFGLPDFAYNATIVSEKEKEAAREIVKGIRDKMLFITERNKITTTTSTTTTTNSNGGPNVFVPFYESMEKSLPSDKASDMTVAQRLYNYLTLLPVVNIDKRPRLVIRNLGNPVVRICPFATFEDLQESIYLMEYSNGVRPYILEWFNEVFLVEYNNRTEPNSKRDISEEIIGLSTKELVDATERIKGHKFATQYLYEHYIIPLINAGYIDKSESKIDRRSYIFFPVLNTKQKKLFENEEPNNSSQNKLIPIEDSTLFPNKEYLICKIQQVLGYSYDMGINIKIKLEDPDGNEIIVEELVERYYKNPENYFEFDGNGNNGSNSSGNPPSDSPPSSSSAVIGRGEEDQQLNKKQEREIQSNNNLIQKRNVSHEYLQKDKIASELQENSSTDVKPIELIGQTSTKLFEGHDSNKLIYFKCYYCDSFKTNIEKDYERHVVTKHPRKPAYPSEADLKKIDT
jgi:hypothetical protein